MIKEVTKPEKVALCRECHGTGKVTKLGFIPEQSSPTRSLSRKCPNCDGSGRVLVSCEMKLHILRIKKVSNPDMSNQAAWDPRSEKEKVMRNE